MYLLIGAALFLLLSLYSNFIYKGSKYFEDNYLIDDSEFESIKNLSIYYSIKKGLFEISVWMFPAVCLVLYILFEMDKEMSIEEVSEVFLFYIISLIILLIISLLRTLFLLNYKLLIKDDKIYYKNLFNETTIDLKNIKNVSLLTYHICIEYNDSIKFTLIPIGFSNSYVIYKLLKDRAVFNNFYIPKK